MLFRDSEAHLVVQVSHEKGFYLVDIMHNSYRNTWKVHDENWQEQGAGNDFFGYMEHNRLREIWHNIVNDRYVSALDILGQVQKAYDYGVQSGIDVYFSDALYFRLKDSDYINPTNFRIWWAATHTTIPNVSNEDWLFFVREIRKLAVAQVADPLSPPIIEDLIEQMKQNQIHNDFCDNVAEFLKVKGGQVFFVIDEDKIYVPKYVLENIYKRYGISQKRIRQYISDYLYQPHDAFKDAGKEKRSGRYWAFSFEKLHVYDNRLSEILPNILDCREHEGGSEE